MTEVAQLATVIDHDMDDLTASDGENKENELTNEEEEEEEDQAEEEVSEGSEEKTEKTPHTIDGDGNSQTKTTQTNGVKEDSDEKKDMTPEAVNGVAKDTQTKQDTQTETNEDSNMSEFDLKKEVHKVLMAKISKNSKRCNILCLLLETNEIPKASGQKLRSQDEQGKGGRVGQV